MNYIKYSFEVKPQNPAREILLAQLAELEFESFVEIDNGLEAYILQKFDDENLLENINIISSNEFEISFKKEVMEQENWNSKWEENFTPINVNNECYIRASFHDKKPQIKYNIEIEPKMSFGTGHHQTTHLMIENILKLDIKDKAVLDIGCGTGVLGILTKMKGAKSVVAIDIDNWSYENAIENSTKNNVEINVIEGDASSIPNIKLDIILANINRNILLNDISKYIVKLSDNGVLIMSGFYTSDMKIIESEVAKNGLKYLSHIEKDDWVSVVYSR